MEIEKQASQDCASDKNVQSAESKLQHKKSTKIHSAIEPTRTHKSFQSKLAIATQSSVPIKPLPSPNGLESDDDLFFAAVDVVAQKETNELDNITLCSTVKPPLSEQSSDIFLPGDGNQHTAKKSVEHQQDILKTPASGSLVKRLKRRLLKNVTTPQNRGRLQQVQKELMENALKDAQIIQVQG